jgi:hypothetical protein
VRDVTQGILSNELATDDLSGLGRSWTPFFAGIILYVGAVSAYDGYLVIRTGDMILEFEKNPIGLFLIHLDGGNPSLFLEAKATGTVIVLTALAVLQRRSQRLARPVALALVVFQSGLLIFMENC